MTDKGKGPFSADPPSKFDCREVDVVEVVDSCGNTFAIVFADDCAGADLPAAKARATRIAESLNKTEGHSGGGQRVDEQMIADIAKAIGVELPALSHGDAIQLRLARAAHSVIAGKVAELTDDTNVRAKTAFAIRDALIDQDVHLSPPQMLYVTLKALAAVAAALAPYPERREREESTDAE